MRKKSSRRPSSRKSTTQRAARSPLQITKETIRTLGSDELTQVVTGNAKVNEGGCPNSVTGNNDI